MKALPRILIADPHPITRRGVRETLAGAAFVVAETGDGREALALARTARPDAALLAINLPSLNGIELAKRLVHERPGIAVIMLTAHDETEAVFRALQSGALSYVLKAAPVGEIQTALREALAGRVYVCRMLSRQLENLNGSLSAIRPNSPLDLLTDRQRDVLQLIAEGQTTKAAALILKLSAKTIEYHRMKIMERLNIFDVPGLVRWALRSKLVSL